MKDLELRSDKNLTASMNELIKKIVWGGNIMKKIPEGIIWDL